MKFKIKKVIKENVDYQSLKSCPYNDSRKRTECRWGFAAAGVLICCPEDGTFLLQHRHDGTWGYPGGGIHPPQETGLGKRFLLPIPESAQLKDNDPIYEETAFQELEEELGWKINNYKLVDYSISDTKGFRYKTSFITITKEEKDNANLTTGSWETVSFGWYTLKDLAKLKLVNGFGEEQINKLKNVIGLNESIKESKMKLTNEDLRRIIKEETQKVLIKYNLLNEGKQEKQWVSQRPAEEQPAWTSAMEQGLNLSDMSWISKVRGHEPIEDIIGDVVEFRKPQVQQKLKDNGFQVDLNKNNYPDVNSLRILMNNLVASQDSNTDLKDVFNDSSHVENIGKVGNWTILLPLSKEGSVSCDISGGETTWCTTKRSGQNLFYSYAGSRDNTILFYVMDYTRTPDLKSKTNLDSRLSIGFEDGTINLEGQDGDVSVDAANKGLTKKYLTKAFGSDYDAIINILKDKVKLLKGINPAREKIAAAAQNLFLLKKMIKDYDEASKLGFLEIMLRDKPKLSEDVVEYLLYDIRTYRILTIVAQNPSVDLETIKEIFEDSEDFNEHWEFEVRRSIILNPITTTEILQQIIDSPLVQMPLQAYTEYRPRGNDSFGLKLLLMANPKTPQDFLAKSVKEVNTLKKYYDKEIQKYKKETSWSDLQIDSELQNRERGYHYLKLAKAALESNPSTPWVEQNKKPAKGKKK